MRGLRRYIRQFHINSPTSIFIFILLPGLFLLPTLLLQSILSSSIVPSLDQAFTLTMEYGMVEQSQASLHTIICIKFQECEAFRFARFLIRVVTNRRGADGGEVAL